MKVDLILANKDCSDLSNGHKRKKKGDIISVQRHGYPWGIVERKTHIIITMDVSDTVDNLRTKLMCKSTDGDKRAYMIPVAKLQSLNATVDMGKVENDNEEYQPFLDKDICSAKDQDDIVFSKDGNNFVSPKDTIIRVQ